MKTTPFVLAMLFVHAAGAEELTIEQQGRRDVSLCYVGCSDQIARMVPPYFGMAYGVSYENQGPLWCQGLQIMMHTADTCQAGCRDLEQVYGPTNSWAKSRYRYWFNYLKEDLVESGLWRTYKDWPDHDVNPGAFRAACDYYLAN